MIDLSTLSGEELQQRYLEFLTQSSTGSDGWPVPHPHLVEIMAEKTRRAREEASQSELARMIEINRRVSKTG